MGTWSASALLVRQFGSMPSPGRSLSTGDSHGPDRALRRLGGQFLLLLALAVISVACGSSRSSSSAAASAAGSSTTATTSTAGATSAQTLEGSEFNQLAATAPAATATLPSPPTSPKVERSYLIALFDDAQSVWRREFDAAHFKYQPARVTVFNNVIDSPCGRREDSGPFYCSGDRTVYLDTRFFTMLLRNGKVGAAAQAYIVGHEIGHHIQRLVGIAGRVDAANRADPAGENARSVQVELQADCLAGVWARSAYPRSGLTLTDLREGLTTAEQIGDDYIMHAAGQVIDEDLWTHGSSAQRQYWLKTGFDSGRPSACNTFAAR
jgi:uncharacterized protein